MEYVILRCGWCGVFCDNTGRIFKATKQLIAADSTVGFDDSKGECVLCNPGLDDDETELNEKLSELKRKSNKYLSTGIINQIKEG